jgi:hypothetical protein
MNIWKKYEKNKNKNKIFFKVNVIFDIFFVYYTQKNNFLKIEFFNSPKKNRM